MNTTNLLWVNFGLRRGIETATELEFGMATGEERW
jgi:hypothetical protein